MHTYEIMNIIGFGVTVLGMLLYASTMWWLVMKSKAKVWASFFSGSILMGGGVVLQVFVTMSATFDQTIPPEMYYTAKDLVGAWLVSAMVWLVFGVLLLSVSGCFEGLTSDEVVSHLDGGVQLDKSKELEGFYIVRGHSYYDEKGFKYDLVKVYKRGTWLNTIRGEQHYSIRTLNSRMDSKEECLEYYEKFNGVSVKIGDK